jgi:Domain of unknown function (DUF4265)
MNLRTCRTGIFLYSSVFRGFVRFLSRTGVTTLTPPPRFDKDSANATALGADPRGIGIGDEANVVHLNPVWRERADFVIGADIDDRSSARRFEQLWARQLAATRFELCCIPFFVYDLALGDEVETDAGYLIQRVVKPSGGYTFRAWFGESSEPRAREEVVDSLRRLGCAMEWYSENLLGVDAPDDQQAQQAADLLQAREDAGHLAYETGRTS